MVCVCLLTLPTEKIFRSTNKRTTRGTRNSFKTMTKCYLDLKYIYMHSSIYLSHSPFIDISLSI